MFRLRSLSLFLAAVILAALAALPAAAERQAPDQRPGPADLMIWEVPATVGALPSAELQVEVLKSGVVVYTETATVELPPVEGARGIEVLGTAPETRSLFATLAERGNVSMEAVVSLDGRTIERLPVAALVARGAALGTHGIKLMALRHGVAQEQEGDARLFAVTAAGWECTTDQTCMDNCWDNYYYCVEYYCNGNEEPPLEPRPLPAGGCEDCDDSRLQCQASCQDCECVDPKSVTTYTTSTYLGRSWQGTQCYDGWTWDYEGTWWDYYRYTYRVDEYEKTTYCDDTTSTRLLRSWYEHPTCWEERWMSSCYASMTGTPWPRCY